MLILLHAIEVGVEEIGRVKRAAAGFGVKLRAEDGAGFMDDS